MSDLNLPPPPPVDFGGGAPPSAPPLDLNFGDVQSVTPPPPPKDLGAPSEALPPPPPSIPQPDLTKLDWNTLQTLHDTATASPEFKAIAAADPVTAQGAADTSKAELSISKMYDIPLGMVHGNLGPVSEAIWGKPTTPTGAVQKVFNTVKYSIAEAKIGELGLKAFMGDDSVLPEIKKLQSELPKPEEMLGGFGSGVISALVGLGYQATSGVEGMLVGQAASVMGMAMFGPLGMVTGLALGASIPIKEQLDHLTGNQYVALLDAGLDPSAARVAAGALTVGLEVLNFVKVGSLPGVKKLASEAFLEGTKRALLNGSFARIALDYVKRTGLSAGTQGLLSLGGAVYQTTVTEAAKILESKIDGKTFTRQNFLDVLKSWGIATASGTAVGVLMSAPGVAAENATIKSALNEMVRKAQTPPAPKVEPTVPEKPAPYVPPAPGEQKIGDILAISDKQAQQLDAEVRSAESSADYIKGSDLSAKEAVDQYKAQLEARTIQESLLAKIRSVDTSKWRPEYAEPLKKIQEQFTLQNFRSDTVAKLSELRKQLEANPERDIPDSVLSKLSELDKTPYKNLSIDDLSTITDAFMHYAKLQADTHAINVGNQKIEAQRVATRVLEEMPKGPPEPVPTEPTARGYATRASSRQTTGQKVQEGFKTAADVLVLTNQEFPDFIAQKIGPTYKKVMIDPVKDGVYGMHSDIIDWSTEFRNDTESVHTNVKDVHNWLSEINVIHGTNEKGQPVIIDVNRAELAAIYKHSLNANNRRDLLEGGFGFRFGGDKNAVFKMDTFELNRIVEAVKNDPNMKVYVDAAGALFDKTWKRQQAVHLDINDYLMKTEDNYYPIDRMPIGRKKTAQEAVTTEAQQGVIRIGLNKGQQIERTGSVGPIYINPITHDLAVSIQRAAAYVNLEKPLLNASRLHYNSEVSKELDRRTGKQTWKVIDKFLKDAAQQHGPTSDFEMLGNTVRNNMATSFMGFPNFFIPIKQFGAVIRYSNEVRPDYLLKGFYASIMHAKKTQDFLTTHSPLYKTRRVEGINMAAAEIMKRGQVESAVGGKISTAQKLMSPISWADTRMSVRPGMMGAFMQALDEMVAGKVRPRTAELIGKDAATLASLGPDAQIAAAIKFAERVTELTQTSGNPALLSDFQRGGSIAKFFTLFQSEGVVGANMRRRAYFEAKKQGTFSGWAKFTRIMALSLLAEPLVETEIDRARRAFTGSKQPPFLQDYAAHVVRQGTGGLPLIRDTAQAATNKVLLGMNYQNQGLTPMDNLVQAATMTVIGIMDPQTYRNRQKALRVAKDMGNLAGALSGLPVVPAIRVAEGAVNLVNKAAQ